MKNIVLILRGPSGVGKSTISRLIKEALGVNWVVIDVDALKHYVPLKEGNTNRAERTTIAHDVSKFFTKELYTKGYNVVLEEMYRQKHNDELIEYLEKNHMRYLKVFLAASLGTLLRRSKDREKNVPEEETIRLYKETQPLDGDFIIDTDKFNSESAAQQIVSKINEINKYE